MGTHEHAGRHSETEGYEAEYAENDADDPYQRRPVFPFDTACVFRVFLSGCTTFSAAGHED